MIKQIIKTILVVLMVLSIAYSISNFISVELKAWDGGGMRGVWVDLGGVVECTGDGNECDIGIELP